MKNYIFILFLFAFNSFGQQQNSKDSKKNWFQEFFDKIDNEYGWGNSAAIDKEKKSEKNDWTRFWDRVDYHFDKGVDDLIEEEKNINNSLRERSSKKLDKRKVIKDMPTSSETNKE